MIVDGKQIAEEILVLLGDSLRGKRLGLVVGVADAATDSFVKIKARVAERLGVEVVRGQTVEDVAACDGIVVQLPHPQAGLLLAQVPPEKDVDHKPLPPVVAAVQEIFKHHGISAAGKRAVVVGEGRLVGKPCEALLRSLGAQVQVVSLERGSLDELRDADLVVSGAGNPGLIKPSMLKAGVVLIDAGTSESLGKLAGDADPACAQGASVFTPVPGGVGPIAVAMLFKNLHTLVQSRR